MKVSGRSAQLVCVIGLAVLSSTVVATATIQGTPPNPTLLSEQFEMDILYVQGSSITQKQHLVWDMANNRCATHFDVSSQFPITMTQVSRYDRGYLLQSSGDTTANFDCQNISVTGTVPNFWSFPGLKYIGVQNVAKTLSYVWQYAIAEVDTANAADSILSALNKRLKAGGGNVMEFALAVGTNAPVALLNINTSTGYHYTNWKPAVPPLSAFVVPVMVTAPTLQCTRQ